MIVVLFAGAAFGGGLFFLWRGLFPPRPSLAAALAELRHLPEPAPVVEANREGGATAQLGGPIARLLTRIGADWLVPGRLRPDLAITGRSVERQLAEQVALGIFGSVLVPLCSFVLLLGGVHVPLVLPVWAALLVGVAGFVLPDLGVHGEAIQRRRDFRHALSSYLDLVVVALAGGAGVETALNDAASIGRGWAFEYLRQALDRSRLQRSTPWAALGQLGEELGVGELAELASSIALAGTEGARVRSSLAAKAMSLRAHELTDAEGAAQATTEKMSLPVVLLFAGFLCFIAFPAVERVLSGF